MKAPPIDLLLIEDSLGDVELIRQGLKKSKLLTTLHVVHDGTEAMKYLQKEDEYEDAVTPDLVLLDINLPKMSGHEVLDAMRGTEDLRLIPVIILTTSNHDNDVLKAYENHANAYVQKPLKADAFIEVIRGIDGFWLSIVKLPPKSPRSRPSGSRSVTLWSAPTLGLPRGRSSD